MLGNNLYVYVLNNFINSFDISSFLFDTIKNLYGHWKNGMKTICKTVVNTANKIVNSVINTVNNILQKISFAWNSFKNRI